MAGKCSQPSCFPDETGCNVGGCLNVKDCQYYNKEEENKGSSEKEVNSVEDFYRIAWTGNSFGIIDINYLTASSKPIVIGIIGVASTGKTSFLASLYCLLRHGNKIGDYSFSGSYTLNGWEDIAWFLSWKENGNIQFPPHTSNNSGRVPGLLHLALKNEIGEKIDLIFTDAPGEWFNNWRINVNDENAKGAKWIHDNSNAFLLFADCDTLNGGKRGIAKSQINTVADRLLENIENRPFGLVWSKSDIEISNESKKQIISHIENNQFVHFKEFETSVKAGEEGKYHNNICNSMSWIIECLLNNINDAPNIKSLKQEDMFLSKRKVNE